MLFNFELGKRYIQTFWVFLFSFTYWLIYYICDRARPECQGKGNNWKKLLIARIFRDFLRVCEMSNVFQPLGQVHMHGAFRGPCMAGLVLKDVKFGHWAKTIISFRLSWLAILLASVHASSSQANQRSRSIEPTR